MIISKIFLATKYKVSQFVGASIVVIGIGACRCVLPTTVALPCLAHAASLLVSVVALLPSLMDPSNSGNGSHRIAWAIVLILSCVPMCLSRYPPSHVLLTLFGMSVGTSAHTARLPPRTAPPVAVCTRKKPLATLTLTLCT